MSRSLGMQKVKLQIPIPAGIADGQTLRLSLGNGQEVFVTVRVEESDYFRREGQDVHTQASISISQAILGGVIRLSGLYEDINLRIPAGTSSHTAMTLSARGIEHMDSSNQYGDHIVHLHIKMPTTLTEEQRELIKEFAYTERDTPGTVNGVDRSSVFSRAQRKRSQESENTSDNEKSDRKYNDIETDDAKSTWDKITDAVSKNETVVKIRQKMGL